MEGDQLDFEDPSTSRLEKTDSTSQSPTMCPVVLEAAEQILIAEESVPATDSEENGIPNIIECNNKYIFIFSYDTDHEDTYSEGSPLPIEWINDQHWSDDYSEQTEDPSIANSLVNQQNNFIVLLIFLDKDLTLFHNSYYFFKKITLNNYLLRFQS